MCNFTKIYLVMDSDLEKVSYAVGMSIGESLKAQNLEDIDTKKLSLAMDTIFKNQDPLFTPEEANSIIQAYLDTKKYAAFGSLKLEGEKFLKNNKTNKNVQTTESGLQYEIIKSGNGVKPAKTDTVSVHYHGTLIDGTVFDSSVERGTPASFGVHQVIPGWTEALQLMDIGSKYRLFIPQELAYGANPHPGGPIQPFSALIFEVELLNINE
jgi:FKBP-type peptidyl-prolyl cis-trans isomerase